MLEVQNKLKRQIELLGMAITNKDKLKDVDFSVILGREIQTIKRDMKDLRSLGIDIHSEARRGICIGGKVNQRILRELVLQYLGMCNASNGFDKATALLVKQLKERALSHVVALQFCIEKRTEATITYNKGDGVIEHDRVIQPVLIFNSERYWRLLAVNDGRMKQYLLNKIVLVKPGTRKFTPMKHEQIEEMFRHSFKSWIGTEQYNIRLHLSRIWAERIMPQKLMESEILTSNADGSVILEATVNSLSELASWVVSRGEGVTVLEPVELKDLVISMAKGALSNYTPG
jgi:predicted DNA-binding transcriptional regulator YafY